MPLIQEEQVPYAMNDRPSIYKEHSHKQSKADAVGISTFNFSTHMGVCHCKTEEHDMDEYDDCWHYHPEPLTEWFVPGWFQVYNDCVGLEHDLDQPEDV